MKNPKLRILLLTLAAGVLAAGCDADYDFGKTGATSHVVVNALLSPQEDFTVKLNWSSAYAGEDTRFAPVHEAEIRLLEEGAEVVRCAASPDGKTVTQFRATAGKRYRLEVTVPGYGTLAAETDVPALPAVEMAFRYNKNAYKHYEIKALECTAGTQAVWLDAIGIYRRPVYVYDEFGHWTGEIIEDEGEESEERIYGFYTTSPFVDQVNGANDAYEAGDKEATVEFEQFLRLPREDCAPALPLRFSLWSSCRRTRFRIVTASAAYDRYMRSLYKQRINTEESADKNPFAEQVTVYTNIGNGLGIFAGCNTLTLEIADR